MCAVRLAFISSALKFFYADIVGLRLIWGIIYPLHKLQQNLFTCNIHLREAQFEH